MIKTKSLYDPIEESDGERVLVSRALPISKSEESLSLSSWIKALAPSWRLLQDWRKSRITWAEYEERYVEEMTASQEAIKALAKRADSGPVTLLCFEKETDPCCHRHLLKGMLEAFIEPAQESSAPAPDSS